ESFEDLQRTCHASRDVVADDSGRPSILCKQQRIVSLGATSIVSVWITRYCPDGVLHQLSGNLVDVMRLQRVLVALVQIGRYVDPRGDLKLGIMSQIVGLCVGISDDTILVLYAYTGACLEASRATTNVYGMVYLSRLVEERIVAVEWNRSAQWSGA